MNLTAFVFPGQGSQAVGMGKDLYENFSEAKEIYEQANDIMGMKLTSISFEGPPKVLKQTYITQAALFVHSYILTKLIGDELRGNVTAGHSLGEYNSNVYANAVNFEDGLKLVKLRGKLMFDAGEAQKGTMAALIGLSEDQINEICSKVSSIGICQPANYNCPGQIIISGSCDAVHKAMEIAKTDPYKCRLVKELDVSGAFHSDLMLSAADELWIAIEDTNFKDADIPIYLNLTSFPEKIADHLKNALFRQMISSVKWETSIRNMINDGVTKFYEIGSGKVLTGLIKKINPNVECNNISCVEDLKKYSLV